MPNVVPEVCMKLGTYMPVARMWSSWIIKHRRVKFGKKTTNKNSKCCVHVKIH